MSIHIRIRERIAGVNSLDLSLCVLLGCRMLLRRPDAGVALMPRSVVLFAAGAIAGAIGKTLTAPLDRVKILLQARLLRSQLHLARAS